ncbi:MAG TPA: hypothetical protein VK673_17655 [Chthoniobacterales bacterium]|nr:hypothetical protein [Chthoniobacterales bacterium]
MKWRMGETANRRMGEGSVPAAFEDEYENERALAIGYWLLTMRCAVSAARGLQGKRLRVSLRL